jgi:hypothetical protein
MIMNTGQQEM